MIRIYSITNKINGKRYIGQSINIDNRWKEHIRNIDNPNKNNTIYKALRKYGLENFIFEVLEECTESELDDKEIYWIEYYDSYNNGYNMNTGGNGRRIDYDYLVNQYKIYKNIHETAKQSNCHWHTVSNALKAKGIIPNANSLGVARPIKQIKPDTLEVINIYNSLSDAAKELNITSTSAISQVLSGKKQIAYGYIWKDIDFDESKLQPILDIKQMHSQQKLLQIDKDTGNVVNTYNSVKDALIALNKSPKDSGIYRVCKGERQTAYGYKWKFE